MDDYRKTELQRTAKARLALQRERVRRLRQRCIAASLICFALLWGVVFTQLVSGDDPVLSGKEKSRTKSTSTAVALPRATEQLPSEAEQPGIESTEAEAIELEAAEIEAGEIEAGELEAAQAELEAEELTTSTS